MIDRARSPSASVWIALSHDPHAITLLHESNAQWTPLVAKPGFTGWTDDYSTILPLLKGLP